MRYISKIKRQRVQERVGFDYILQLWFNYHFLFFRTLMFRGLKLRAFKFFVNIKKELKKKEQYDPSFIFFLAILQITPSLYLRPFKLGGSFFEIPYPLDYWKKISYGCRWIIKLLKDKNRIYSVINIVDALVSSLDEEGLSMEKKFDTYDIAESNRHLLRNKIFNK